MDVFLTVFNVLCMPSTKDETGSRVEPLKKKLRERAYKHVRRLRLEDVSEKQDTEHGSLPCLLCRGFAAPLVALLMMLAGWVVLVGCLYSVCIGDGAVEIAVKRVARAWCAFNN